MSSSTSKSTLSSTWASAEETVRSILSLTGVPSSNTSFGVEDVVVVEVDGVAAAGGGDACWQAVAVLKKTRETRARVRAIVYLRTCFWEHRLWTFSWKMQVVA